MAKFYGKICYGVTEETRPGIWEDREVIKNYQGELIKLRSSRTPGESINDNITLNNQISILADPFISQNFSNILYLEFMGTKWKVSSVEVEYPRLILSLGGVYND